MARPCGTRTCVPAVMPRAKVTIEHNWDVMGLQGTGSHDIVVKDVVVPEEWTFIRGGASSLDTPLYRYPALSFAAQVLTVVGLGVARAAINEVLNMAAGRKSVTGAPNLGERVYAQLEVAKIEAELRAAVGLPPVAPRPANAPPGPRETSTCSRLNTSSVPGRRLIPPTLASSRNSAPRC